MRALLLILILLATWFVGGMYGSLPLMALCVAELAAVGILALLPLWWRLTVRVGFAGRTAEAVRGKETVCRLTVRDRGPLPVGRMELRMDVRYLGEAKGARRKLWGGAGPGENALECRLRAPWCGIVVLRLERVRYLDYLDLFSCSRRSREELRVAVYPEELPLRLSAGSGPGDGDRPMGGAGRPGDGEDLFRMREYRPGEPVRRVRWDLTARTGQLWIKEHEKETDLRCQVLLDAPPSSFEGADAYWRLLSSLILGLLELPAAVRAWWRRGGDLRSTEVEITGPEGVRDLLLRLYAEPPDAPPPPPDRIPDAVGRVLRLTADLRVYEDGRLLFQTDPGSLDEAVRASSRPA